MIEMFSNGKKILEKGNTEAKVLYHGDANNAPANSILLCQPDTQNLPTTAYGELITLGGGSRKSQLYFGDNNFAYHRIYVDDKWMQWKQFN